MADFDAAPYVSRLLEAVRTFAKSNDPSPFNKAVVEIFKDYGKAVVLQATPDIVEAALSAAAPLIDKQIAKALADRKAQLKAIASTPSAAAGQNQQPKQNGGSDMSDFRAIWD